jgi:methyl-accepting chemotaxis protein
MAATGVARKAQQDETAIDNAHKLDAFTRFRPYVELQTDGTIITANELFLRLMGYALEEIRGRNDSLFVPPREREGPEYAEGWAQLRRGVAQTSEYKRLRKDGQTVWLSATYYPVLDHKGTTYRVLLFATDITKKKIIAAEHDAHVAAANKAQAAIEYDLGETILTANENFLKIAGYSVDEIQGKQADIFVDPATRQDPEYRASYRQLWEKLRRGETCVVEGKRVIKSGQEIWIRGSYYPLLDADGKPYKVVNYFQDITEQKT